MSAINCSLIDFVPKQDERELKRQRRKQSNRESARRSRLRKQVPVNFVHFPLRLWIIFPICSSGSTMFVKDMIQGRVQTIMAPVVNGSP